MFKNLKNAEWSKRLLVFIEVLILLTLILVCVSTFEGLVDPLVAFITGVFTLASIAFGFYYWKAKNENIRKYAKELDADTYKKMLTIARAILTEDVDMEGDDYDE